MNSKEVAKTHTHIIVRMHCIHCGIPSLLPYMVLEAEERGVEKAATD